MRTDRRAGRALLALFGVAGLGGCLELVPVAPPPEAPAILVLALQITSSYGTQTGIIPVRIAATLDPGVDGRGRAHRVADDSLWVWDQGLYLRRVGPDGRMILSDTVRLPAATLWEEPIRLRPPRIEGMPESPATLAWSRVRGLSPDTLVVTSGDSVALRLYVSTPGDGPNPTTRRWNVSVSVQGRWFGFGEEGAPPNVILIPPALLGEGATGMFSVVAVIEQHAMLPDPDASYRVNLSVQQLLRWHVQVLPPEGPN